LRSKGQGDAIFKGVTLFFSLSIFALTAWIGWELFKNSKLSASNLEHLVSPETMCIFKLMFQRNMV